MLRREAIFTNICFKTIIIISLLKETCTLKKCVSLLFTSFNTSAKGRVPTNVITKGTNSDHKFCLGSE